MPRQRKSDTSSPRAGPAPGAGDLVPTHPELARLLAGLNGGPADHALWLVVADWLEEQGQPERAELTRLTRSLQASGTASACRVSAESRVRELLSAGVRPCVPEIVNSIGMRFALIPAGTFWMGSPEDEEGRLDVPELRPRVPRGVLPHPLTPSPLRGGGNRHRLQRVGSYDPHPSGFARVEKRTPRARRGDDVAPPLRFGEGVGGWGNAPYHSLMTTRLEQRKARLRAEYGFDFPDGLARFWEFACRLAPLDPLNALAPTLGVVLVGPFEVLHGRFDGRVPRRSLLLHWRYHDDPPEFFTCLAGDTDGLHWGYFLDDPTPKSGCVASYYARDAYEITADGDDLFEAMRLHLEYRHAWAEDADPTALEPLARVRSRLMEYATADRPEVGDEYTERYAGVTSRTPTAQTMEGMGVVVPEDKYRPLSMGGRKLWKHLRKNDDLAPLVEEARIALAEGHPGTALLLGKNLWACVGERKARWAGELLEAAYEALGRPALTRVLQTHLACRGLPSVDILEE